MAKGDGKTSGAPRVRRNRDEDVVRAAIEVFDEKSYAAASIQDVAARVGMLKGSLYHYIDCKEDLLVRIFDGSNRQSFALMEEVQALEASPLERLREFARLWALWYMDNIERVGIYFNEWTYLAGERLARAREERARYERFVSDLLVEARARGEASEALDPRFACFFILAAVNGLTVWYSGDGPDRPEHIAGVYAEMIVATVRGVGQPAD